MVQYDFDGKIAFVTGGARAQGRSHAINYARNGADVVVADICDNIQTNPYALGTADELDETVELIENEGQEALGIEMDVRNESDVENAVEEALDTFGHIDVLANNAGIYNASMLVEMDEQMWDEMLDTNLKGVWLCAKHVGQHFIERGDGGKIVSTSSGLGLAGAYASGHYGAAKWGIRGLTKTLALELAEYDVNVNCIAPTVVNTPMIDGYVEAYGQELLQELVDLSGPVNLFHPEDGGIEPQDISEAYLWLSSDAARYVTGITLPVDAGQSSK